jgi:hypothetical protein
LRAGLLSEKEVIRLINENFICTWALVDDVKGHAGKGNRLASVLAANWEYPLDTMFLTPSGEFVAKLNSFRDFPNAHIDVGHPEPHLPDGPSHSDIFLKRTHEILLDLARRASILPK